MFDKILVPLDGSAAAEGVLPLVRALVKSTPATVTFLHVADPDTLDRRDPEHAPFIERLAVRAEARARDYLRRLQSEWGRGDGRVSTRVISGPAAETIIEFAPAHGHDLIAMSTHGRSGVGRWAFGSVADRVLHATRLPVLLVRPPDRGLPSQDGPLIHRVVVPLDGSTLAEAALPYAEELARRLQSDVRLVRAVQHQMGAGFGLYAEDPVEVLRHAAEEYLRSTAETLRHQGLSVTACLAPGQPAERIIDAAQAAPGSLVVLSSHGRSGASRWALGSVADKVVRALGCPVLLVRPSEE